MLDGTREETDLKTGEGGPDTKEAEALAAALNHSAERVQTLWFSFLTFMVYLAIAAGTTTHRMLFLESPLNLPVLNIALPLLGFYILAPIIFVVFHFYMLLNLVLLARTAKSFEDSLARAFPEDGEARENFRMRIENTLFVQLLVGGRLEREGINAKLLSLMALITLAVAPVALLLYLQIKFLPYHSEWITWLHRGLMAVDLVLVWTLWPGYRSGWGIRLWPRMSWRLVPPKVLSVIALFYAVAAVTFPDEPIYLVTDWIHGATSWQFSSDPVSLIQRNRSVRYAWILPTNSLDLREEDLISDAKLNQIVEKNEGSTYKRIKSFFEVPQRWTATFSVAGRDFTEADLGSADIRHVDFSGAVLNRANLALVWATKARFANAQLRGALLSGANLQGVLLNNAQLQGAWLENAQLQGASLKNAQLEDTLLSGAHLQGASLNYAQLRGANLETADAQGAVFNDAQIQGASLDYASLEAARLENAQLQGASLDGARLQGVFLSGGQLQGASLKDAQLQSAWLNAQLQGAILDGAQLQGAWLENAQLQGASLKNAQLREAWLANTFVWRSDAREANWEGVQVIRPDTGQEYPCTVNDNETTCAWTSDAFEALKGMVIDQVPEGDKRRATVERIKQSLDPSMAFDGEREIAKEWTKHEQSSAHAVSRDSAAKQWSARVAEQWREVGCAADGAPYVIRALLAWTRELFHATSPQEARVAAAFLDTEHCPGARGLAEDEIAELKALAAKAQPPAPKR
jgi:uncharacterized protein YjbI with pentapeptide repeats